jgi:glutamyl-Q tRNA(Asp) synthetase
MFATRFAPSPTGLLHLGHAYSAMVAHDVARSMGGQFLLRIDDLDDRRVRDTYRTAIIDDLAWLGLVADGPPVRQSRRRALYDDALGTLRTAGLAYPCFCSRSDIAASVAAPHLATPGPDGPAYPGTCRALSDAQSGARMANGEAFAWRLDMARAVNQAGAVMWVDAIAGPVIADPLPFGDVILARRDGVPAYHLASTVDDAVMAISHVVRGADLFAATHIHRLLQALLALPTPHYHHHRLIGDTAGRRLAKRYDAASLAAYREQGMAPATLVSDLRRGILPPGTGWAAPAPLGIAAHNA